MIVGGGAGDVTVSSAVMLTPPRAADIPTCVEAVTVFVVTVKIAVLLPAETVTVAGTEAAAVLLLESVTTAPPAGAGTLSVTVPVDDVPPVTLAGLTVSEETVPVPAGRLMNNVLLTQCPPEQADRMAAALADGRAVVIG